MQKIAIILSGCGVFDGSEIHESVITMLQIDKQNFQYQCIAPNINKLHVIDHTNGEVSNETRNVLQESARIARGEILDLAHANPNDYAALIIPGGFGVAKNLSNYALQGAAREVEPDVLKFAIAIKNSNKPIGLICIAPTLAPAIYGPGVICSIGNDADTSNHIQQMGGDHKAAAVDEIVVDAKNKLVTTPAYMLATRISQVENGIAKLVARVIEFITE